VPPTTRDDVRIEKLRSILLSSFPQLTPESLRVVKSPYRVCPLGAHVDHQLGLVTGMTVDRNVLLVYAEQPRPEVRLLSVNFPGQVSFSLQNIPAKREMDWGNYARGAAYALKKKYALSHGIVGVIEGNLPVGGLSSSAAVGIAYLLALEQANHIEEDPIANIEWDRLIENEYIGLNNGILDQSTILLSEADKLLCLDCQDSRYELVTPGPSLPSFNVLVVYSGISKFLGKTGYNSRVAECHLAALELYRLARNQDPPDQLRLRYITAEEFQRFGGQLNGVAKKRSSHFFGELQRVQQGMEAWRQGDLHTFGNLMTASGASSIENYECGSPHLISIYELLRDLPGVYGTRFSGAGFRGCCIAFIDPDHAPAICRRIAEEYPRRHPDIADVYEIHVCTMDHGARIL